MKIIAVTILALLALVLLLHFLNRNYSAQYFRKMMKPGDHCQVPYKDDWQIGVITEIRAGYVLVDLPDRMVKVSTNDILPI